VAAAAVFALLRVPLWSQRMVVARLQEFFGRTVTVGALRYDVFPRLRITVDDVRVAGAQPSALPFLEARQVVLVPRLRPLWERRALLGRLHVVGLRLRANVRPDGSHDLPAFATGEAAGREVRVDRLVVEDGALLFNHQRVPLDVQWEDVSARLFGGRAGLLTGRFGIGRGEVRFGDAPPLALSLETELSLRGARLWVTGARVRAPRTDLLAEGAVAWGDAVEGSFHVQGAVDLGVVDAHVTRTGLGLAGHGRAEGTLSVGGGVHFAGTVSGEEGAFEGVPVPRFSGQVRWDEDGVRVRDLELEALGGTGTLQVLIPPGRGRAELEAQFAALDAEALAALLFDVGAAGLGASVTGEAVVSWPRGHIRHLSGTARAVLEPAGDARTPLHGQLSWTARDGVQRLEPALLATPAGSASLSGVIQEDRRADLSVDAAATDLAAAEDVLTRVRRALGAAQAEPFGMSGAGRFEGRWRGSLGEPVFEGRFAGQDLRYRGVSWGRAEWAGTLTTSSLASRSLVLRKEGAELWVDGQAATGDYGAEDALDVRVRLVRWPAEDLARALEWDVDVSGRLTGEAEVAGRRSAPRGSARLRGEGRWRGVAFQGLALSAVMRGSMLEVAAGRAGIGGGEVRFQGVLAESGVLDGVAELAAVPVAVLVEATRPGLDVAGELGGRLVLQGTAARPRVVGMLRTPGLRVRGEEVGACQAALRGAGDGQVHLEGGCHSERTDVSLRGTVAAAAPYHAEVVVTAGSTTVSPLLRAAGGRLPEGAEASASGEAALSGPLLEPAGWNGTVRVDTLELRLPDFNLRNRTPLRAGLREGTLTLEPAQVYGDGTDLSVEGAVPLEAAGALGISLTGAADVRVVSLLLPEVRGRGAARLAVSLAGTPREPRIDGTLSSEGATLRVRGFPHGIEDVRGEVRFTEGAAEFVGVRATVGGGPVELAGEGTYAGGRLRSFDLRARGTGMSLRYPEGMRSVVDADLRAFGDMQNQWLTGTVDVRHAVWSQRYDVASELLAETAPRETPAAAAGVRLDVKVSAPGTLRVDNNLAQLTARADFTVQGTTAQPVVLGRAEIEKGRVYFQGNTYVIRRGGVEFANPRRLDPLFDIEAETRVRSYRITLRMNGTLQRVYPTLTADPYLNTVQILSLLAGVDEATVDSYATTASRDVAQGRLAAAGAASLAAGRLSEEVGLERGAAKLGLDRFSIDPAIVRANVANPTARITLGKRVTPDLNILYSVDLRGTEERLVSLEYTLSDRLSVLLTRDNTGFGFDLRVRQSR
jgi:autotransporter translocation and assembly factor TamB